MSDALMRALREADPARVVASDALSDAAMDLIRDGVVLTSRQGPAPGRPRRKGRWGRRAVTAGLAGVALVGGGAAFGTYDNWFRGGTEGVTCMTRWVEPGQWDSSAEVFGGASLTGDAIADCQRYQQLTGSEPIVDPVAIRVGDSRVVAPRGEVPSKLLGSVPVMVDDPRVVRELEASMQDRVDGGVSACFTTESAPGFVAGELKRLNLTGWTYKNGGGSNGLPCGFFALNIPDREVLFFPERDTDQSIPGIDGYTPMWQFRDQLRGGIAQRCVSLKDAKQVVNAGITAIGQTWPSSFIEDESRPCATVDMEVAGSMQVTVRGPAVARP